MSYAFKKAGIPFVPKVNLDPDMTGLAGNFSLFYINDSNQIKTDVTGAFTESPDAPGLYFGPAVTINETGSYTINIVNNTDGLGNVSASVVVANATIDDIKDAIDTLTITVNDTNDKVTNLTSGANLDELTQTLAKIKDLVDDRRTDALVFSGDKSANFSIADTLTGLTSGATGIISLVTFDGTNTIVEFSSSTGTFQIGEDVAKDGINGLGLSITSVGIGSDSVDSVLEFVEQINSALTDGTSGLSALKGFTDDIENMLLGTEFLADGTTQNPFYDVNNPGVAKASQFGELLTSLQTELDNRVTTITNAITTAKDSIEAKIADVNTIVQANSNILTDAGFGLESIKNLIDNVQTSIGDLGTAVANNGTNITSILNAINDASFGLEALKNYLVNKLDSIETKVDNIESATTKRAYAFI